MSQSTSAAHSGAGSSTPLRAASRTWAVISISRRTTGSLSPEAMPRHRLDVSPVSTMAQCRYAAAFWCS
ncbi:MAG: hypothetical protein ACOH2H_06695 [Cypionkella sp.]